MERIGRYQIVGEIGKGAMGVVYKATDPNIGRDVAIKTTRLDIHGPEAEEMLQRFKNEARAAGVLNHPNLITIYDAGEQDGIFYIVMEYIQGRTLQAVLKQERVLPVERVVDIARQVCAGLDYAHARGIIHRDIKPANIMIADAAVKIMDFGIAKGHASGMTSTGQVVGTPNYMSPEQVKGKPLDGRSDLFSLGVVMYEVLTGARPFAGENVTTIIYKIVNETPPPPDEVDASVHPGLSAVVMKALAKAPEQRYASGADFARALQNYRSLEIQTSTTPVAEPIVRPMAPGSRDISVAVPAMPAAAAPKPATQTLPTLDSTVSALPAASRAATPAPKTTRLTMAVVATVLLVMLGLGAYRRLHRGVITPAAEPTASEPSTPSPLAPAGKAKHANGAATPQPPRPAVPGATGDLQISSSPFGAAVTIDGKSNADWVTPFAAKRLKAGRHTVNFLLKGYQPEIRQVEVVAGQKLPLIVPMQLAYGYVSLNSDPAGAAIYLDGVDSGQVTPARLTVNEGRHRIALRKEGFKPQITYAEVTAGKTFNFAPALQPGHSGQEPAPGATAQGANPFRTIKRLFGKAPTDDGVLEVRTRPRGAQILLGDSTAPSKTPAKLAVAPGTYTLTLRLPGYKPITRSVQVEKGKVMGVDEILEPQ